MVLHIKKFSCLSAVNFMWALSLEKKEIKNPKWESVHAKWTALLVFFRLLTNKTISIRKEMETSAWKRSTPINIAISLSDLSLSLIASRAATSSTDKKFTLYHEREGKILLPEKSVNLFYLQLQSLESTSIINWIDLRFALLLLFLTFIAILICA